MHLRDLESKKEVEESKTPTRKDMVEDIERVTKNTLSILIRDLEDSVARQFDAKVTKLINAAFGFEDDGFGRIKVADSKTYSPVQATVSTKVNELLKSSQILEKWFAETFKDDKLPKVWDDAIRECVNHQIKNRIEYQTEDLVKTRIKALFENVVEDELNKFRLGNS